MVVFGLFATAHADVIAYGVAWDNIYNGLFTFYNGDTGAAVYPVIELPSYTEKASATINGSGPSTQIGPTNSIPPLSPVMVSL